jgi:hypothetical protein
MPLLVHLLTARDLLSSGRVWAGSINLPPLFVCLFGGYGLVGLGISFSFFFVTWNNVSGNGGAVVVVVDVVDVGKGNE